MDSITQFFISEYDNILNVGFICNLMIFLAFIDAVSAIIGILASVGKD